MYSVLPLENLTNFLFILIPEHMDKVFDLVDTNPLTTIFDFLRLATEATDFTIKHPKVKALLSSDKKFDLVISEISLNDALFGMFEFILVLYKH